MSGPYYRQFRREFGRGYYRPQRIGPVPAAAIGAVVVLAAIGTATRDHAPAPAVAPAAAARPPAVADAVAPSPRTWTPRSWTVTFLRDAGDRATRCNVVFVLAWIRAEGSTWGWRDPLDDELPEPGSYRVNTTGPGQGVQAYPSWREGLAATVRTFGGPDYSGIRAAVAAGNDAQAAADAVGKSKWGTEDFEASC